MAAMTDTSEHVTFHPTAAGEGGTVRPANTVALVAGGAGLYFFSDHSNQIAVLRDNWWARGAILLVVGYYLHRRGNSYANIIIGLGVVMFTRGLQARDAAAKGQKADTSAPDVGDLVF